MDKYFIGESMYNHVKIFLEDYIRVYKELDNEVSWWYIIDIPYKLTQRQRWKSAEKIYKDTLGLKL